MHQQHPDTFEAPDMETLKNINPGDFVRVCAYQERFWAQVISLENNQITARVDNNLLTPRLRLNDIITFHPENIYEVLTEAKLAALKKTQQEISRHLNRRGKL